jgi:5-formyltetrahydrofolate cyclo-ligase
LKRQSRGLLGDPDKRSQLENKVRDFFKGQRGNWAGYQALSHELELSFLWQVTASKQAASLQWYFPKLVAGADGSGDLAFTSAQGGFQKNSLGFYEPQARDFIDLKKLDGMIVPAVAFDREGFRLGQGLGFYDRVLQGYQGLRVGITFTELLQKDLPRDSWDEPVDVVITESEEVWVR